MQLVAESSKNTAQPKTLSNIGIYAPLICQSGFIKRKGERV